MEKNNLSESDEYSDDNNLESKDFMDILNDTSSNILTNNFLKSKKKLAQLNDGKSETFTELRLKGKALEMMNYILCNNNELILQEDLIELKNIKELLNQSKTDKILFETTSKKVKMTLSYLYKNQLSINSKNGLNETIKLNKLPSSSPNLFSEYIQFYCEKSNSLMISKEKNKNLEK